MSNSSHKAHCLILPYPVQGHINPMLQFSKRLQSKGVKITIAPTKSFLKNMKELPTSVSIEAISDGYDDDGINQAKTYESYLARFKEVGSDTLAQLIKKLAKSGCHVIDWMSKIYPIKTIGPTIPSMYLDKRLHDDKEYGLSMFKPMTNECLNWLNHQPISSVLYVSFGSLAKLGSEQMEELAWGLKNSNKSFLWVVRSNEESKLPNNFLEELTIEKGLVVSWCPQLQVLEHESIGCFLTHCGWNSTLEEISLGVPIVTMPQWTDQPTNAKLVKDVWEIGVRAKQDEKGVVRREVIEECIKLVMEEDKGKLIRENAKKWKEIARNVVNEGGSSDKNIEEFVSKLMTISSK
uniref:UDP-glycosyltransferases domain-containing protein n=2 Tax=Solanum lycopersicum TaxID=4081 RepID=A0A3Q7HJP4_SOLLC